MVDGYNLIYSAHHLQSLAEEDLGAARDKLVQQLSALAPMIWDRVLVVFDAYNVPGNTHSAAMDRAVTVIFTRGGETADQAIERLVPQLLQEGPVEVATSDNLEQQIVFRQGANRLPPRELWLRLQEAEQLVKERRLHRREALDNNLPEPIRQALEKLRRRR